MNHEKQKDEILLSFADVKAILRRSRKNILFGALAGALIMGSFTLFQPIQYSSNGTFIEKGKSEVQLSPDNFAANLLKGDTKDRMAMPTIKSRKILEGVIKKLDLQATIEEENHFPDVFNKLAAYFKYIPKNLMAEYASLANTQKPLFEDPQPEIKAAQISYEGEVPLLYQIRILSESDFLLTDRSTGTEIAQGRFGEPLAVSNVSLVLHYTKKTSEIPKNYRLTIVPLNKMTAKFAKDLKIACDFNSKSFLELSFKYSTRHGVYHILNAIMAGYRDYLLTEHHRLVGAQIDYLKFRQNDIDRQTAALIEEQAAQLASPAGNLDQLAEVHLALNQRYMTNELKLKQLQNATTGGSCIYTGDEEGKRLASIQKMMSELQQDRKQCDNLVVALEGTTQFTEKQESRPESNIKQFDGIDLETAKTLFPAFAQEQHEIEAQIAQLQVIAGEIHQPSFEPSALTALLKDSVSQELINAANVTAASLKDTNNYTAREIGRLEQDLALQKMLLASHIEQTKELLSIKYALLKKHTQAIQQSMLDLLQKKITIGEKHLSEYLTASVDGLQQEQKMIHQQQREVQLKLNKVPQQWINEKLINLHLEANGIVLQQIGNLIETKNISDNLDTTLSAPLDLAILPLQPEPPHLLLYMLLGGLLGSLAGVISSLVSSASAGILVSKENLEASGQHVSGFLAEKLKPSFAQDLEALRRLITRLCSQQMPREPLLLLLGNGRDYSQELAVLLHKRGLKVLIMSLSFDKSHISNEPPGLLSYLEGKLADFPQVLSQGVCDIVPCGGESEYGAELLESEKFEKLIRHFSEKYDWIILTSNALPSSAEAESLLKQFDVVAISINDERLPQMKRAFDLGRSHSKNFTYLLQ